MRPNHPLSQLAKEPAIGSTAESFDSDASIFEDIYARVRVFAAICAPYDLEPEDLLQEALANTLARGPLSRLDNPTAYLRAAMLNIARSHVRSRGRDATLADSHGLAVHDTYPCEIDYLASMPPNDRTALFLVDVERLSYASAAATLGCSEATIRTRLFRARRRLRKHLQEEA